MAQVIRVKLTEILAAIKARLVLKLGFPPERVLTIARDNPSLKGQSDQVVWIRPRSAMTRLEYGDGAGRFDTRVSRRIQIILTTRLELDEETQDLEWLENTSLGHLDVEHSIIDALEIFAPENETQDWLLDRPMRMASESQPQMIQESRPEATGWGSSTIDFDVVYILDLDQTEQ